MRWHPDPAGSLAAAMLGRPPLRRPLVRLQDATVPNEATPGSGVGGAIFRCRNARSASGRVVILVRATQNQTGQAVAYPGNSSTFLDRMLRWISFVPL